VTTSDASYTAPAGVTSVTLTGAWQTVHGNDAGDTFIVADNTGNAIFGGAGDDVFQMGRAGDWVTGGGGHNTYAFGSTPWVGAHITDFNPAKDVVDLSGLLAQSNYHGSDPVGDGYIKITADAAGNAQVWSDLDQVAHAGWWLVVTLDGVATSGIAMHGDMVTGAPVVNPQVSVSDASYSAPAGVTGITLTGSWQTVHGNNAGDTFVVANGTGNALYGGAGDDTFVLGRSGDWVTGGGGSDTFVFPATPWAAGGIMDFGPGDKVDLTGLLAQSGYTGSDPVGAGFLKITDDGQGDAQIWSHLGSTWWLVTTLEHEAPSSLHVSGAFISG
jgi:Ca2+-binding RTX toxin-like protein